MADATVQITRAGPGLPLRSLVHLWPLPPTPPPPRGQCLSRGPVRGVQDLAMGDLRPERGMIIAAQSLVASWRPLEVNVTWSYGGRAPSCSTEVGRGSSCR